MARRKELKSIGIDLLNAFISRNNDVGGYWGIAMLRELMHKNTCASISINLLSKSMQPNNPAFDPLLHFYWELLRTLIVNRGLRLTYVHAAQLTLTSDQPQLFFIDSKEPMDITCALEIKSDLGKVYSISKTIECRRHNKQNDVRSSRLRD